MANTRASKDSRILPGMIRKLRKYLSLTWKCEGMPAFQSPSKRSVRIQTINTSKRSRSKYNRRILRAVRGSYHA